MRWYLLSLIVCGFILLVSSQYSMLHQDLWWDSHVYIAQGKFLFSGGEMGLWEVFRPPLWSIILGLIWLMGIQPVSIIAPLTVGLHTLTTGLLCYLGITQKKPHVGILAGLYTGLSPVLLLHVGLGLTESLLIPLCVLLMILVHKKRWVFGSLVIGLAFLTKFTAGLLIVPYLAYVWWINKKEVFKAALPAASILCLYLLTHYIIYNDPFIALSKARWIVTTQTELYTSDPWFYLAYLAVPLHLAILIPGSVYQWFLTSTSALYIFYHSTLPRKEVRYLAIIVPFFAYAMFMGYEKLRKNRITVAAFFVLLSILTWHTVLDMDQFSGSTPVNMHVTELAEFLDETYPGIPVLSSNPRLTSYTDRRVIPMGHPTETLDIMRWQKGNYEIVYYNNCDFAQDTQHLYDTFTQWNVVKQWSNTSTYTGEIEQTKECNSYVWDLNNETL